MLGIEILLFCYTSHIDGTQTLYPVTVPRGDEPAPEDILKLIKCQVKVRVHVLRYALAVTKQIRLHHVLCLPKWDLMHRDLMHD